MIKEIIDKLLVISNRQFMRGFDKVLDKNRLLVGAEIGVDCAVHAKILLRHLNIKKLHLIDPYRIYKGIDGSIQKEYSIAWIEAHKNLKRFKDRIVWYQLKSEEAVKHVPDNLDFVYIDGNHTYKFVKKDIELYYPKIKSGGLLGGHDYNDSAVARAVIKFATKHNLTVNVSRGHIMDWWVIKNGN